MKNKYKTISFVTLLLLFLSVILNDLIGQSQITDGFEDETNLNTNDAVTAVTFGIMSGPADLDPHDSWDSSSSYVQDQVCEALFMDNLTDPDLELVPVLAKDFGVWNTTDPSAPTYTVELRDDVWFHDGTKFNALAAKWNFDRLANLMDLHLAKAGELYEYYVRTEIVNATTGETVPVFAPIINKTTVLSEYVIEFTLNVVYGAFEAILSFNAAYQVSPAATDFNLPLDTANGDLVGTGPFVYDSFEAGVEVLFHANDFYWRPRANIDFLIFSIINDAQIRNYALLSGDVDIITDPMGSMLSTFTADPDITLFNAGPGSSIQYLGMNNYWINTTFRKAISYALNYTFIIEELFEGQVGRLKSPVPEVIAYANRSYDVALFNRTKARQYMQSMGFGVGFTTDIQWQAATFATFNYTYNIGNNIRESMLSILVDNLDYIGIDIVDAGTTWPQFILSLYELAGLHRDMVQIYWLGWIPDYNDASNYINPLFTNRSVASNGAKYNGYLSAIETGRDPFALMDNVQLLMEAALLETDAGLRQTYYNRIQELLVEEDMPWAFGCIPIVYAAYRQEISGFKWNSMKKVSFYEVIGKPWDAGPPSIYIISPILNQFFEEIAPDFIVEIYDLNLDSMWYTIDGGLTNIIITTNETIDQGNWTAHADGFVVLTFYANDTFGHINSSQVIIIKDTLNPTINILSPTSSETFGIVAPDFIVEIYDANLDTMWYTIDGGLTNITFTTNGTIDQDNWTAHANDNVVLIFYANDTFGRILSSQVIIIKDTLNPTINILSPTSSETFGILAPNFIVEINDVNIDAMWYTIDGGLTNITFTTNETIDQTVWNSVLTEMVVIRFYANDTLGRIGYSEVVINKDVTPPVITINHPEVGDIFAADPPVYDIDVNDVNLDTMWYTLDNGATNTTISVLIGIIDGVEWNNQPNGYVTIRFYANDTMGGEGTALVIVTKNTPPPEVPPGIPGVNLLVMYLTLFIGIPILIWQIEKKNAKLKPKNNFN